jgi:hypothetical protein
MSFTNWGDLLDNVEAVPDDVTLRTPLSEMPFRVRDVHDDGVSIGFEGRDETQSLQRDRFETLYRNVTTATDGFELDRLPPSAEPYAAILSLHPRVEIDESERVLAETDAPSPSPLVEAVPDDDRRRDGTEPSIQEMLANMGDPSEVTCPIDGCQYSHRSASSVARHVSGSSTAKHIWENTAYAGWRDFVRKHGESPG